MNVEIAAGLDRNDDLIISVYTDPTDNEYASIGWKRFIDVGEFRYDWVVCSATREELVALSGALQKAVEISGAVS